MTNPTHLIEVGASANRFCNLGWTGLRPVTRATAGDYARRVGAEYVERYADDTRCTAVVVRICRVDGTRVTYIQWTPESGWYVISGPGVRGLAVAS